MSTVHVDRLFQHYDDDTSHKMMRQCSQQLFAGMKMGRSLSRAASALNVRRNLVSAPNTTSSTNPDNLPHLPVPPLNETLQKYLRSVRPLLSDDAFCRTEQAVNVFATGSGGKLHEMLQKRAASSENWLSDWWLKFAYLGFRSPVVIHSNPGLFYSVQQFKTTGEWLSYTARTISATMRYKDQIDKHQIPAERMGKSPLDMAQYGRIFGTCRIPAREFDRMEYHPKSTYIVVAYRNGFYKVPVYDPTSNAILDEATIVTLLKEITADKNVSNSPIGALTAQNRDVLAEAYEVLMKDPTNTESVRTIQRALFVVCLDKAVPLHKDTLKDHNTGSHQLIHGGGSRQNSANRWFDKTLQLIVNENGLAGLNYEHSPGEGQPIAVLSDAIMTYTKKAVGEVHPLNSVPVNVCRLQFNVDGTLQKHLDAAMAHTDELAANLDMHVLDFTSYGKNFIKSQKMSPDSYIQMAMQYAFYKKHGVPGAHYESAHLRMFIHGRTETIRSCSIESIDFARAMGSPTATDAEKVQALRAAVDGHKNYTMDAVTGKGVDRLLLGLKLVAREQRTDLPAFYADDGFVKSTHFRLSTSQVASVHRAFMCYGPGVEDGYGICYNPRNEDMLFAVSAFPGCAETSAEQMGLALSDALNEMYAVLARAGESKTSKL